MKPTEIIVGTLVVIAVAVIYSAEGIPRPQQGITKDYVEADGFVFDGPAERSRTSTRSPPIIDTTVSPPIVIPTFTPPLVTPSSAPPTGQPVVSTTQNPVVAECIQNCRFRVTSEYNPVCGTDRNVYSNAGLLRCARACGHDVEEAYIGPCTTSIRG